MQSRGRRHFKVGPVFNPGNLGTIANYRWLEITSGEARLPIKNNRTGLLLRFQSRKATKHEPNRYGSTNDRASAHTHLIQIPLLVILNNMYITTSFLEL
jgi:hypothetical protein